MSNGALRMPEIADTAPHSARRRAFCAPNAPKYFIIAIPPFRKDRLWRYVAGDPGATTSRATRGSHTLNRKPVGSAINASYSSARMNAWSAGGSRYWKPVSGGTSIPGTP